MYEKKAPTRPPRTPYRKKLLTGDRFRLARKSAEIYEKYKIMPQLQLHMLRVAAVVKIIC